MSTTKAKRSLMAMVLARTPPALRSYVVGQSVKFDPRAGNLFGRTPGSAGNLGLWTYSAWCKPTGLSETLSHMLFSAQVSPPVTAMMVLTGSGAFGGVAGDFELHDYNAPVWRGAAGASNPNAWYHIVAALDSSQASAANRLKVWVNGNLITPTLNNITLGWVGSWNTVNPHGIGDNNGAVGGAVPGYGYGLKGLLADVQFIDGAAVDYTQFGQTVGGVWMPKAYAGSYGGNGFHLNMVDASASTPTALGRDVSGNGNNWTPINLPVPASIVAEGPTTNLTRS